MLDLLGISLVRWLISHSFKLYLLADGIVFGNHGRRRLACLLLAAVAKIDGDDVWRYPGGIIYLRPCPGGIQPAMQLLCSQRFRGRGIARESYRSLPPSAVGPVDSRIDLFSSRVVLQVPRRCRVLPCRSGPVPILVGYRPNQRIAITRLALGHITARNGVIGRERSSRRHQTIEVTELIDLGFGQTHGDFIAPPILRCGQGRL
ncbi:hypothetical protein D3C76_888020 [compost metagenome]